MESHEFQLKVCNCFDNLRDMGVIFQLFLNFVVRYIQTGKPICIDYCECCRCKSVFQMIFLLESHEYIKVMEKNDKEFLIVPTGLDISSIYTDEILLCICDTK